MVKKLLAILAAFLCIPVFAETYKVYVPVPAGTSPDAFTRKLTEEAEKISTDKFIIMNKLGGEFMINYTAFVNDSTPSLHLSTITSHVVPYSRPENKNDPLNETKSVIMGIKYSYSLVVPIESPIKTVKDIKGKINIGYAGGIAPRLLNSLNLDPEVQLVAYKSDTDASIPLLKNEIQVGQFISIGVPRMQKEKLRTIGNFDHIVHGFLALSANSAVNHEAVVRLNKIFNQVLQSQEFVDWSVAAFGVKPVGGTAEACQADIIKMKSNFVK